MFNLMQFISISLSPNKSSNQPVRLAKIESKTRFEEFCEWVCPYVLLICILLFSVLLAFAFVKYGADLFSTPQNRWEHMEQSISIIGGLHGL